MNYWVTSDTHFGHYNIIRYCDRPFKTLEEMNETIIRKWNDRVKPEDTVFFLGDFCFRSGSRRGEGAPIHPSVYSERLNGKLIYIRGNHDKNNSLKTIIRCLKVEFGNRRINMVHRPEDINWECDFNLVGHVHEKWKTKVVERINYCDPDKPNKMILINCGVDVHNFYPVKLMEAVGIYEKEKRKIR